MEEILREFVEYLEVERNYSWHTISNYEKDLSLFILYLNREGITKYRDVNYQIIRNYLVELHEQKYKNKSVTRHLSSLRTFFKYLMKENMIKENPMNFITNPKVEKKLPHFLYYHDMEELLEAAEGDSALEVRNACMLELLYSTGIRVSELVSIKLEHVSLSGKKIRVLGKGDKERIVLFGDVCKKKLERYLSFSRDSLLKHQKHSYLFVNHIGRPLTDRGVREIMNQIIHKKSLNMHVSPHMIRHTFATHMLNEGADLKTVQDLLGHENLETTGIYTHVSNEHLRRTYLQNHPRAKK